MKQRKKLKISDKLYRAYKIECDIIFRIQGRKERFTRMPTFFAPSPDSTETRLIYGGVMVRKGIYYHMKEKREWWFEGYFYSYEGLRCFHIYNHAERSLGGFKDFLLYLKNLSEVAGIEKIYGIWRLNMVDKEFEVLRDLGGIFMDPVDEDFYLTWER